MPSSCPYLPPADPEMNWRALNGQKSKRGIPFYLTALRYAQALWLKELPARAILAVDRALLTDLTGEEPELTIWPLPYQAMAWMLANYEQEKFVGNPRIHFQHLATRVRGSRKEQRRWRAWACWYLTTQIKPWLEGDAAQNIEEPSFEMIADGLRSHGIRQEFEGWYAVVNALPEV